MAKSAFNWKPKTAWWCTSHRAKSGSSVRHAKLILKRCAASCAGVNADAWRLLLNRLFSRKLLYLEDQKRAIVGGMFSARECVHGFENAVGNAIGREFAVLANEV